VDQLVCRTLRPAASESDGASANSELLAAVQPNLSKAQQEGLAKYITDTRPRWPFNRPGRQLSNKNVASRD